MDDDLIPLGIEDYEKIKMYNALRRPMTADSCILDLFLWYGDFKLSYFLTDKGMIWVSKSPFGGHYSVPPFCKKEDLSACFESTRVYFNDVCGEKLCMYSVDEEALETLNLSPDEYDITYNRDGSDYVYDAEMLREFPGKNYHKKKNHKNAFLKEYDGRYEFRVLFADDREAITDFLKRWIKGKDPDRFIDTEYQGIQYILDHLDVFECKMAGVYVDGVLEAFTMGQYYSKEDMLYLSVEKANADIRGLYPYICSEFLKRVFPKAKYENREDDMGLSGLRQAKLSYHPVFMSKKYTIKQK